MNKITKEFETLNSTQKEDVFNFILFILFKRKIKNITNQLGETSQYIKLSDIIN